MKCGERVGRTRRFGGEIRGKETTWETWGGGRCGDNIKMDLQEMEYGGMGWIALAWDRSRWRAVVNAVMNPRVP